MNKVFCSVEVRMVRLEVHDGSRRRTVVVQIDPVRIGRDDTCEVQLPGDPTVSRLHAILRSEDGHWVVQDGGSRNGTYLNGRKVSGQAALDPCDRLLIGNYVVVFQGERDDAVETVDAPSPNRTRLETGLSAREMDVLRLVCAGHGDLQVATELFISVKTVHSHLDRIRDKTGCRRRVEMVRFAIDHGIA